MNELLPIYTWIRTKDGVTGVILVSRDEAPQYLAEYDPLSQAPDDINDQFVVSGDDIIEYKKP